MLASYKLLAVLPSFAFRARSKRPMGLQGMESLIHRISWGSSSKPRSRG